MAPDSLAYNSWVWGEVGDGVFGFPGFQGWDDTWFLKSTPPSIPAGGNQLHFDLLKGKQVREATLKSSLQDFPWGNSHVCFLLRSPVCDEQCWCHSLWSGNGSLVLVSFLCSLELGFRSSWQGEEPQNSPVSSLWAPSVQTGWVLWVVGTSGRDAEKTWTQLPEFLIWSLSSIWVYVALSTQSYRQLKSYSIEWRERAVRMLKWEHRYPTGWSKASLNHFQLCA